MGELLERKNNGLKIFLQRKWYRNLKDVDSRCSRRFKNGKTANESSR